MNTEFYCFEDEQYLTAARQQVDISDLILVPLLGCFAFLLVLETSLLFRIPYILRRIYLCNYFLKDKTEQNKVTIVRGVPGSGKKYYVYHQEKDREDRFALCDWNEYFLDREGNYNFKGSELGRAEQYSRLKFIRAIAEQVKRIYVVGYFNEDWMYYEYEKLAKVSGYEVEIVDIECPDHRHLLHFNKRSSHNTPYSKSLKCYNNWEHNESNTRQEPYIENFPGDVIPSYGVVTRSQLDKQLEDYKNNKGKAKCLIETESDCDEDRDTRDYSDIFIEFMEEGEKNLILEREFYETYDNFIETESELESEGETIVNSDEETADVSGNEDILDESDNNSDWEDVSKDLTKESAVNKLEEYEYIESSKEVEETMTDE